MQHIQGMQAQNLGPVPEFTQAVLRPFLGRVAAGFPSPAEEHRQDRLDLNRRLIRRPSATFFFEAQGDSMEDGRITSGDLLIVERVMRPASGRVVIATVGGENTVKTLRRTPEGWFLFASNPKYPPIPLSDRDDASIFGVVTAVIHLF